MQWSQNLCRICGQTSNETCHQIYREDLSNEVETKIKKCFRIELFQNDFKPKQLCNPCFIRLDDFYEFLLICHATDQKFDSMLIAHGQQEWRQNNNQNEMLIDYDHQSRNQGKINNSSSSSNSSVIAVNPNQISNKSSDRLNCSSSSNFDSGNVVLENLENCSIINEHEMLVEIVGSANLEYVGTPLYTNESTVLRHSSDYQMQENLCSNNVVVAAATIDNNNYNNSSCQQQPQQQTVDKSLNESCQQHASNNNTIAASYHHNNEINSTQTNFPQTSNIVIHQNSELVENNKSSTTILSRNSRSSSGRIVQAQKNFQCPHCERSFKRRMTLNAHISTVHKNQRPFVCDVCKKSYAQRSDLTNHKKIHLGCYKCDFCPHSFSAPSKLQRHLRGHTKQKPFACDVDNCLRAFSDKRNLDAHKISLHSSSTLTQLTKFDCENCAKTFKTRNRLRQHSKVHSSNCQSYVCEVCFKAYKYKCTLMLHLKKHNGFFCPYCRKDCERVAKLLKHRKNCPSRCKDDNKDVT